MSLLDVFLKENNLKLEDLTPGNLEPKKQIETLKNQKNMNNFKGGIENE